MTWKKMKTALKIFVEQGKRAADKHWPLLMRFVMQYNAIEPIFQAIEQAVRQWREQYNVFEAHPKICITAHKLFNALLVFMYLVSLIVEGAATFNDLEDIVFLPSWDDTDEQRLQKLERFRTTVITQDGYQDLPWLCIASSSKIRNGLDLTPASKFILVDNSWKLLDDIQCFGRIHRQQGAQCNPWLECIRIVPFAKWFAFALWQTKRHADKKKVQTLVQTRRSDESEVASLFDTAGSFEEISRAEWEAALGPERESRISWREYAGRHAQHRLVLLQPCARS